MSSVICNSSPLQYLHQTGMSELLPTLFGGVTVPEAVVAELEEGRRLGVNLPDLGRHSWIKVEALEKRDVLPQFSRLGRGEMEVLSLGVRSREHLLLFDDLDARCHAQALDLHVTGTLSVLLLAKKRKLIPAIQPVLDKLDALGFRLSPSTRQSALKLASESQ